MSMPPFTPGIAPVNISGMPRYGDPLSDIVPFTRRNTFTFLKKLEELVAWVRDVASQLEENQNKLLSAWIEQAEWLIAEFDRRVDWFMNNSVELQDPVMAALIADTDSLSRKALDALITVIRAELGNDLTEFRAEMSAFNSAFTAFRDTVNAALAAAEARFPSQLSDALSPDAINPGALKLEEFFYANLSTPYHSPILRNGRLLNPDFKTKVQGVVNNTGSMSILCAGDSTVAGVGSDGLYPNDKSWPTYLARAMHGSIARTAWGAMIPPIASMAGSDPRWTLGPGWTHANVFGAGFGNRGNIVHAAVGSGVLNVVDPRDSFRYYDIYYLTNPGVGGTFTAQIPGGEEVVVPTRVDYGVGKATVQTATPNRAGVNIVNTGGSGTVWIVAVVPRNASNAISIGNAGSAGSTTGGWLTKASATNGGGNAWNAIGIVDAMKPDLIILDLGINDSSADSPVETVMTNLLTLADAFKESGAQVMFKTFIPSQGAVREVRQREYVNAIMREGALGDYPVIDLYSHYRSHAKTSAKGWMSDWGHGNAKIYEDQARIITELLFRYSGH